MGTVLNPQDLPSLSSDIVKPQYSTTTQPQQASHEEKAKYIPIYVIPFS